MSTPRHPNLRPPTGLSLLVSGLLLAGGSLAGRALADPAADTGEAPSLQEPFPFDHDLHAKALQASKLTCTDCHPVGLAAVTDEGPAPPDGRVAPPHASCHGCHLGDLDQAPRAAPSTCFSCHADLTELTPSSHGPAWVRTHAPDARAGAGSCRDCHETAWCFACHDDRGPTASNPHGPGFRVTHGVEARLDSRSCSTCHTGDTCTECHQTGGSPW